MNAPRRLPENWLKHWQPFAGSLCLAAAALAHDWLEASMLRHMLLQLPLLLAAGWLLAGRWQAPRKLAVFDQHGAAVLTALLFASAYWMVPRALEQSLTEALAQAAKFTTMLLAGALLPGALRRANVIVQIFFLGNFSAMTAIAGMLYQDLPQQLCNAYFIDDQVVTGMALVALAIGVAVLWSVVQLRQPAAQPNLTEPA